MYNDPLVTQEKIFARNCLVTKIDKKTAEKFIEEHHILGNAKFRYAYGMFQQRKSGAKENNYIDKLVAVATFSNARKWEKGDKIIRSYEWIRYACLENLRVVGGMGKLLNFFIKDVNPDDIMTYALSGEIMSNNPNRINQSEECKQDLGYEGNSYYKLGFVKEREIKFNGSISIKFRLKLTEWR